MGLLSKSRTAFKIAREGKIGWQSYIWNTAMAQMRRVGPLLPPIYLSIEPTNACNAQCPVCETGKGELQRKTGLLPLADFTQFIDKVYKTTAHLNLAFMGESFLNKNAYEMIRHAREKNIYVETVTNGDLIDAKGIIYSDINKISFQIGGMTEESNARYRVGTSLSRIQANLYSLIEERNKNFDSNVKIELGFIVMRHNEHEVDDFLSWAEEIGVDTANIIDPCVRNIMEGYAYLPRDEKYWFYDREAFAAGNLIPSVRPDNECAWIWNSLNIFWDGSAVPCCRDPNGKHILGNVFDEGLMRVFNSKAARSFRANILGKQEGVDICSLCSGYGLPDMSDAEPMSFEIRRHTFNPDDAIIAQSTS
tara:strand:+ start:2493 stop:3584 length:1092 start_codon:yes stop_codon:yes gene_type:complete